MRGLVGEIITRFEHNGLKHRRPVKMIDPDDEHYVEHYEGIGTLKTRKGKEIFESQFATMKEGPVIAMVLEGVECRYSSAQDGRRHPAQERSARHHQGRLRARQLWPGFKHRARRGNIVHASADSKEAAKPKSPVSSKMRTFDYDKSEYVPSTKTTSARK